jgi:putative Mn2+ efflux pump MntP
VSFRSILLLAAGLAMDATAVAAARGLAATEIRARHVALIASFFGGAQALMPLLGWAIGQSVGAYVAAWDHWIAFALLAVIGGKMVWESRGAAEPDAGGADPFRLRVLCVLAIATSIDAFAVGVTLPMLGAPLALSVVTIGVTTAALSVLGLLAGRRFGAILGRRVELVGGLVLVALGVKILVDHLGAP